MISIRKAAVELARELAVGTLLWPSANGLMIQLTRLNNNPLAVNSDLIKFVEQAPDTVITLVTGEKIVVRESAQEVLDRVVQYRRRVLQGMQWCDNPAALSAVPGTDNRGAGEK